jgi:hypothetical protein
MNRKKLLRKIAYLEFINDQTITELRYIDKLLRIVGFPNGLETVKSAAHEVMRKEHEIIDDESEEWIG